MSVQSLHSLGVLLTCRIVSVGQTKYGIWNMTWVLELQTKAKLSHLNRELAFDTNVGFSHCVEGDISAGTSATLSHPTSRSTITRHLLSTGNLERGVGGAMWRTSGCATRYSVKELAHAGHSGCKMNFWHGFLLFQAWIFCSIEFLLWPFSNTSI